MTMSKAFAASLMLFGTLAVSGPAQAQEQDERVVQPIGQTEGQQELAKMLEGRVAGEPERCLRDFPHTRMTMIDGTALVFRKGGTVWVNRTRNPEDIDDRDRLVVRKFSATRTCRTDVVTTEDRVNGFYTGTLFLTDFVPYRLPES